MTRAAWQGYITLGRLGIPIRLYTGTQSIRPKFVQLHEKDSSPVERVLQCRDEHREIPSPEVIRAVEYEPGRYITLTDRELDEAATSPVKTIDIKQFCSTGVVDPIYFEKPFYAVPTHGGERAYALLREVFTRSQKMAITRFVMYGRERIAALFVQGDLLMLNQLRYAAEIVPRSQIKTPPLPKPSPSEIEALQQVVERFSGPFYLQDYHDEYAEHLQELVERKVKGLPAPRRERAAPHATPETEIEDTLRSTLDTQQTIPG